MGGWCGCSSGCSYVGLIDLVASLFWSARAGKTARPLGPEELLTLEGPTWNAGAAPSDASYTPTDDGVRIEQLKSLAALRDSGALTEAEFEAEKRRVLES